MRSTILTFVFSTLLLLAALPAFAEETWVKDNPVTLTLISAKREEFQKIQPGGKAVLSYRYTFKLKGKNTSSKTITSGSIQLISINKDGSYFVTNSRKKAELYDGKIGEYVDGDANAEGITLDWVGKKIGPGESFDIFIKDEDSKNKQTQPPSDEVWNAYAKGLVTFKPVVAIVEFSDRTGYKSPDWMKFTYP